MNATVCWRRLAGGRGAVERPRLPTIGTQGQFAGLQALRSELPKQRKTKQRAKEDLHQSVMHDLIELWTHCMENYNKLPRAMQVLTRDLHEKMKRLEGGS